jgi:hypothetical protein
MHLNRVPYFLAVILIMSQHNQRRSQLEYWGIHIHIFVFRIINFFNLKSIVFKVCEQEYMNNMEPRPPPRIIRVGYAAEHNFDSPEIIHRSVAKC